MYVSHCTCGALSIALVVRCTPVARDNSGERDIPAPSPAAFLGFSTAASSSPCEFRARRLFQLIEPAADDVQWNGCRPPFVSATRCLFKANSSKKQRCTERYSAPIAQRRLCNSLLLLLLLPPKMPESDASWAVRRHIYIYTQGQRPQPRPRHWRGL